MGMGLVVKVDASEVQAPAVAAAIKLFFICFGAVFLCVLGLTLVIKRMLDSIERAWVEGKAAVEHEKQQFYSLVKAMYPLAVAERLLVGETEIVYSVPHTAVFFSDIYQFTQMSNSIRWSSAPVALCVPQGTPPTWRHVLKAGGRARSLA